MYKKFIHSHYLYIIVAIILLAFTKIKIYITFKFHIKSYLVNILITQLYEI